MRRRRRRRRREEKVRRRRRRREEKVRRSRRRREEVRRGVRSVCEVYLLCPVSEPGVCVRNSSSPVVPSRKTPPPDMHTVCVGGEGGEGGREGGGEDE